MNTKIIIAVAVVGGVTALVALMNLNGESKAVDTEVKSQELSEVSLPQDLPNVPMYPGSVLQNVQNNDSNTERNVTLSLGTEDSVSDIIMWYRGALSAGGWAVVGDKNVGGYVLLEGEKDQVKTFVQAATRSDLGKTIITQRIRIR